MDNNFNDAQLSAILQKLLKKDPTIKCPSGKLITKLCINPKCSNSFTCSQVKCPSCGIKVHQLCPSITIQEVTHLLNQRVSKCRDFLQKIFQIGNESLQILKDRRRDLVNSYSMGNLQSKYQHILKEIYENKGIISLSGRQAKELCERLQYQDLSDKERTATLLEGYKEAMKQITKQILELREGTYRQYLQQNYIDSCILRGDDSKVREQILFLKQTLHYPKNFHLLYRGSQNAFSAEIFHKKCDGIPDTLTLVRTQFGKTIAGFTHYQWKSDEGTWIMNPERKTFLLSLDCKQKMLPKDGKHLIYCSRSCGPAFGYGSDLKLSDRCNQNMNSFADFPTTYNLEGENKYTIGQQSYEAFSGATKGKHFRVLEYQVFRVIFK